LTFYIAPLQPTVAQVDLGYIGIDMTEEDGLTVGQIVHGIQRDIQPRSGVVDGEDVDGLAVVGRRPAGSALCLAVSSLNLVLEVSWRRWGNAHARRVPAPDGFDTADIREARHVALLLPVVLGLQAVGAVRAGYH
jgi:hypothetical protein